MLLLIVEYDSKSNCCRKMKHLNFLLYTGVLILSKGRIADATEEMDFCRNDVHGGFDFNTTEPRRVGQRKITIYYFYNNPCSSCDGEGAFYKEINADLGNLTEGVELECLLYNVFYSGSSARFHNICEKFSIPKGTRLTPMVIINGSVLIGQKEIDSKLATIFSAEKNKVLK